MRTVAAIEVSIRTASDRADLLTITHQQAATDPALHVDDVSARWNDLKTQSPNFPPEADGTLYVGVWRGVNDEEQEADASDMGHKGRVWLTFPEGRNPDRSLKFRRKFIAAIRARFTDSREIPILPSGGLPLAADLRETAGGYKVARPAAARYDLPAKSNLLAPN
ncbi:MAG: hypothetical protein EOP61_08080 [Sphingomonadales bacterium]|nr:MAG: hypothetical protein EOP61_08080 [Sphingomonadales bacterium]